MSAFKRHWICDGDVTEAGGIVKAMHPFVNVRGRYLAFNNDPIECPKCNSTGFVKLVEPWRGIHSRGFRSALEHDLCICKCNPPPKLVAGWTKGIDSSSFEVGEITQNPGLASHMNGLGILPTGSFEHLLPQYDQTVILKDDSGHVLAGVLYKITMPSGEIVEGKTDDQGMTEKVYHHSAAHLKIEVQHDNSHQHSNHAHDGHDACGCCSA